MTRIRETFLLLVALVFASASAFAQGTYTQINYPGAVQTYGYGIDAAGDVVGYYGDSSDHAHGFLLSEGTFTSIDFPGGQDTVATGINDFGQVVGIYVPNSGGGAGYLYDIQTQSFTEISSEIPGNLTEPMGINNAATIVGFIYTQNSYVGFTLQGRTYREDLPPGYTSSFVNGISNSGEAVGCAVIQASCVRSYRFSGGKSQPINIPDRYIARGINAANAIVGSYRASEGTTEGFLLEDSTLQKLIFPGSGETVPYGISDAGEVVGYFTDTSGGHGFTWTPPAAAGKK